MRDSTEDMFLTDPRMARNQPKRPLPRLPGQVVKPGAKLPQWATIQQAVAEPTVGPDRYSGHGFLLATLAFNITVRETPGREGPQLSNTHCA